MARLVDEWKRTLAQSEPRQDPVTLVLGDGRGNVTVGDEGSPVHLARILRGETLERVTRCLNFLTAPTEGVYVQATKLPHPTYQAAYLVRGLSSHGPSQDIAEPFSPLHAWTHWRRDWGLVGRDALTVFTRMLAEGRVEPTDPPSMSVRIASISYRHGTELKIFPDTTTTALTVSESMPQMALITFLPATNTYGIKYGTASWDPQEPDVTVDEVPLASILLMPDTTAIYDTRIKDRRDILTLNANAQIFNFLDLIEIAEPDTPDSNVLRLYVEDIHGFSFFKYLDATGMKRQLIRDSMILVKNVRGTTIAANRIVYATGNEDNVPTVDLAQADNEATMPAIGVTIETIADGDFGRVMQVGLLENVNTVALAEGDVLYVSGATPGVPTITPPVPPNLIQEIGTILVSDAAVGAIQIIARGIRTSSADYVPIADDGGYFVGDHVEAALQELGAAGGHAPVTLGADADVLLGLTGQEINFDTQAANLVLAGPASGGAADPTFRALVDADIPSAIMRDAEHTAIGDASPHHAAVTAGDGVTLDGQQVSVSPDAVTVELSAAKVQVKHGAFGQSLTFTDGKYVAIDHVRAIDGDGLALYDDGGNGIFVKDGGCVGVGMVEPGAGVEIKTGNAAFFGTQFPSILLRTGAVDNTDGFVGILVAAVGINHAIIWDEDSALRFGTGGGADNPDAAFTEAMRIDKNANVGIGSGAAVLETILTLGSAAPIISTDTADGSDNKYVAIAGGGNLAATRGAYVWALGNEHASYPGQLRLYAGNVNADMIFETYGTGRFAFNVAAPLGLVHIDQTSTTAAIPVLVLDQADESEGLINFIGSDRGSAIFPAGYQASVRVELNGTVYIIPLLADA